MGWVVPFSRDQTEKQRIDRHYHMLIKEKKCSLFTLYDAVPESTDQEHIKETRVYLIPFFD